MRKPRRSWALVLQPVQMLRGGDMQTGQEQKLVSLLPQRLTPLNGICYILTDTKAAVPYDEIQTLNLRNTP